MNHNIKNLLASTLPLISGSAFMYIAGSLPAHAQTYDESVSAARSAIERYDFSKAASALADARKKMRADIPSEVGEVEMYERQLSLAKNFINRVEHLEILDSVAVPKADFFKYYRLPSSAGYLDGPDALPYPIDDVEMVFSNEEGDFKMWAMPDTTGFYNIAESILLTDGEWSKPTMTPPSLADGANAEFPFMMADGVTLYFASDGKGSMGGYDIFRASRDPQTGEYLLPQNMGMPYNSPFDDYMLAIDEENGVGWWVTDRNQLGDELTLYLFKLNDSRINYNPEEETADIRDLAHISDYKSTQNPDNDYTELLGYIKNISLASRKHPDFHFQRKGGGEYITLDDFQTSAGKRMMSRYLDAEKRLNSRLKELSDLRHKYADNPSAKIKDDIRELEKATEAERLELKKLRNEVYQAEGN